MFSQSINPISNRMSAKAYICKCLLLSGRMTSHTFIMQLFRNSPSVNGRANLAISSTTIKLAFTAASLCDFDLVKKRLL